MAVTVTKLTGTPKNWDCEVHDIEWGAGSDTTVEVTTGLSVIYKMDVCNMFGANAAHTEEDQAEIELDETKASGVITVSGGAVTINRIANSADGTLAAQSTQITLWGKS